MTIELAGVLTQTETQLATDTGRTWAVGRAPGGTLTSSDYPYGVIYVNTERGAIHDVTFAGGTLAEWVTLHLKCVGLSSEQAESLADRAKASILTNSADFDSAATRFRDRRLAGRSGDDDGRVWNVDLLIVGLATAV